MSYDEGNALSFQESKDLHSIAVSLAVIAALLTENMKTGGALNLQDLALAIKSAAR